MNKAIESALAMIQLALAELPENALLLTNQHTDWPGFPGRIMRSDLVGLLPMAIGLQLANPSGRIIIVADSGSNAPSTWLSNPSTTLFRNTAIIGLVSINMRQGSTNLGALTDLGMSEGGRTVVSQIPQVEQLLAKTLTGQSSFLELLVPAETGELDWAWYHDRLTEMPTDPGRFLAPVTAKSKQIFTGWTELPVVASLEDGSPSTPHYTISLAKYRWPD